MMSIILALWPAANWASDLEKQRSDFVLAEQQIERGNADAFRALADALTDYPLYPYLQYQWLKRDLAQSDDIRAFLSAYKDTRYAGLLRGKWLNFLAERRLWQDYINNYQADGDVGLECLYHWSRYQTGFVEQALVHARQLWMSGSSLPGECEPLFEVLTKSALMNSVLIWQRFELALKENNRQLAEYLARLLTDGDRYFADLWLQVDKNPELIREDKIRRGKDKYTGRIFAHGVDRMARKQPDLATQLWDAEKAGLSIDDRIRQMIERRLALALAFHRKSGAYDRLDRLIAYDSEVREWKVRTALFEQNWQHASAALAGMTLDELKEARWQYWRARALTAVGSKDEARRLYAQAANDRSYYGFLAADAVSSPYRLTDMPVPHGRAELMLLANEKDFQAVQELRALGRDIEAQRQWWFAVNKLSKDRLALAAKLAESWEWTQIAIKTLVRADYWDDLALRFPVQHLEHVRNNADQQSLDPAIVLGVMRQESMLDSRAESAVGAKGLMQIMPRTGRQIAGEIKQTLVSESSLFDPGINIRLGAYYFKKLLKRFGGHVAVAAAAYNAGPAKVASWLPASMPVPADIWIETIPFKETRKYVSSVLAYAIIYQHRLHRSSLKILDFMKEVQPG
ncbi:MAG: transglycosylase SLT domain-containing protein [Gammaproteobacteria bacterium]